MTSHDGTGLSVNWDDFWGEDRGFVYAYLKDSMTKSITKFLKKIYPDGFFLEVGCGEGHMLGDLDDQFSAYGIDFSNVACLKTRKIIDRVVRADLYNLPFKDAFFEVVFSQGVMQTLLEPKKALNESFRVVKRGGFLAFTVPRKFGIFHVMDKIHNIIIREWPEEQLYWNKKELEELVKGISKNFEVQTIWFGQLYIVVMKKGN